MTMALSETVMHFGSVREANANGVPALIPHQPTTYPLRAGYRQSRSGRCISGKRSRPPSAQREAGCLPSAAKGFVEGDEVYESSNVRKFVLK
jgi:hypothetical protein